MATKYLYGAAVQGIQSFIFQTNELKDIVGASELVEQICTEEFERLLSEDLNIDKDNFKLLLRAAGNIKCEFHNEEDCRKIVLYFPKMVMEMAPGITISQAVIKYDSDFGQAVDELERRLRSQRNRPALSLTTGLMGIERSRATGLPAVEKEGRNDYYDKSVVRKRKYIGEAHLDLCKNAFGKAASEKRVIYDVNKINDTFGNNWIAVIHIDGNGLGQVVQRVGKNAEKFRDFSINLDESTKAAAQSAYNAVCDSFCKEAYIPIRPIVLGGDDFTVICRADFAVEYAEAFIRAFETETKDRVGGILRENNVFYSKNHLTACGGIAFIKSSYPFYYGYELAEALCSEAKKDAKADLCDGDLPKSCLMFHKVQDSFIQNYKDIETRELTPYACYDSDGKLLKKESWKFGPYYVSDIKDNMWSVKKLTDAVRKLNDDKESNAVKSHMRRWMSLMHEDRNKARQLKERSLTLFSDNLKELIEACTTSRKREIADEYPVYDILALNSVKNLVTKAEKED